MQVFIKTQIHHLKQSMAYNEPLKFIKSYTIIFDFPILVMGNSISQRGVPRTNC